MPGGSLDGQSITVQLHQLDDAKGQAGRTVEVLCHTAHRRDRRLDVQEVSTAESG
jgi:hypothetical protein